jgi:hypothetical protein
MIDSEIAVLLRALLEQFRDDAEEADVSMPSRLGSPRGQTAAEQGSALDDLRGRQTPRPVPTMWRQ